MVFKPQIKYTKLYGEKQTEKLIETVNKRGVKIVKVLRRISMITEKVSSHFEIPRDTIFHMELINYILSYSSS